MKKISKNVLIFIVGFIVALSIGVYAATQIASSSVIYKDEVTVESAINDLYDKTLYLGKIKVGDYVKMTPTLSSYTIPAADTGYTEDQTINPSELNIWRIISINSDGTADAVSEYVSSTDVYFQGKTGYQNFIGTLNKMASSYSNSKYVARTRHMGHGGGTLYIADTTKLDQTTAPWTINTSNLTQPTDEILGAGDMGYDYDYKLVKRVLGSVIANEVRTTTSKKYWIASRYYYNNGTFYWNFKADYMSTDGYVGSYDIYDYDGSSFISPSYNNAIRPIITLKSRLTTNGGDGKSESTVWTFS